MSKANDEAQIRALIDDWAKALRAKDVEGVLAHVAADIVTFDLAPPLTSTGADAKGLQAWFSTWRGPLGYDIRDLSITAGDDVAFCRSLNRISGARTDGEQTDVWVRATVCYHKTDGQWMVTHEHVSVPFYMDGSNKAAVDLKYVTDKSGQHRYV
ncbi:MAG: YybH family protein, partial [Gammaproteobacteria bacterium]